MLKGPELGKAIAKAIELKENCSQAALARHFNIKPPSVSDWIKYGRVAKDKLPELFKYFSDVVGPDHWGIGQGDSEFAYVFYQDILAKLPASVLLALRDLASVPLESQQAASEEVLSLLLELHAQQKQEN